MRILRYIYTIWAVFWLAFTFLLCYPLMFIGALHSAVHRLTHIMNKVWAFTFFRGVGFFDKKIGFTKIKGPVVYCANHTSYLDIPLLFRTIPGFFMIIGKSELAKVPLFGFVFSRVYITVNRKNAKDAHDSYKKCIHAIEKGRSIVFFPEGTIPRDIAPKLGKFKEGCFRLAIEKKVPLVPVALPYNWRIFPDYGDRLLTLIRPLAIFSTPIQTKELDATQIQALSEISKNIIEEEITKYN